MGIPGITVDTHTLVWYIDEASNRKLTEKAIQMIDDAEKNSVIYVSTISLMEVIDLSEKGRISISFRKVFSAIDTNEAYKVISVSNELIRTAIPLQGLEIHDRLIAATDNCCRHPGISLPHSAANMSGYRFSARSL